MSCPAGFDPFGDRDAELRAHAETCPPCAEVLRVLETSSSAWRYGLAEDKARAFYRERRLSRGRPPARTAVGTLVVAVALAGLSGYALARRANARATETRDESPTAAPVLEAPAPVAPRPIAPKPAPVDDETSAAPDTRDDARPPLDAPPPVRGRAESAEDASRALWDRATELLDAGDRAGAERAFLRVMQLPKAAPGLQSRATFRWAELLLSRGDTQTPRPALRRLVRSKDGALGFDAALLLERCAPEERAAIWDAYLEGATDPELRARAERRR
jgi:hypothetical protein